MGIKGQMLFLGLMALLVSFETVAGLETLQTVHTGVVLDVVVVSLDMQFQLVPRAEHLPAVR